MGRVNHLFAGSHRDGELAAIIYSFMATCKLQKIDPTKWLRRIPNFARPAASSNFISLFNGNIGAISINNAGFPRNNTNINGAPLFYNYRYDQLNRLVSMQAYNGFDATNNLWSAGTSSIGDYREAVSYDPNGNIMTYNRKGAPTVGSQADMDDLTYHYDANTNQLNHITDAVTNSTYTEDLETQGVGNYHYDAIGKLTKDAAAGITNAGDITWNVYGKITSIKKNGNDITYTYDPSGNRITKRLPGKLLSMFGMPREMY